MDSPWDHKESDMTEQGQGGGEERLKTQHRKCHWILRMLFLMPQSYSNHAGL